jgi:hypothetical protein
MGPEIIGGFACDGDNFWGARTGVRALSAFNPVVKAAANA